MERLHEFIHKYNNAKTIKLFPKYVIKKYIKMHPHNYFEIGFINDYYIKNPDKAEEYYKKAIKKGNEAAMYYLGRFYLNWTDNIKGQETMYNKLIKKGVNKKLVAMAKFEIAEHIYINQNDDFNAKIAFNKMHTYLLDAVKLDISKAIDTLASFYYTHNINGYYELYEKASALNNVRAIYELACLTKQMKYYIMGCKLNYKLSIRDVIKFFSTK